MASMDFGIPDLSNAREPTPDATRRRGKAEASDFSEMLDRAADEHETKPREANSDKAAAAGAADKPRDKMRRADPAEKDAARDAQDDQVEDAEPTSNQTPAQEPTKQAQDAADAPKAQGSEHQDHKDAASAGDQANDNDASGQPAAQPAAPVANANPAPPAQPQMAAPTAPAAPNQADAAAPVTPVDSKSADAKANEAGKKDQAAAPALPFAEQLAATTTKPTENASARTKQDAAKPVETSATQPAAPPPDNAAAVAPVAAPVNTQEKHDAAQGNPAPQAATPPATPAVQVPQPATTAQPVPQQTPATADDATADDDASLVAVLRAAGAPTKSAAKANDGKPTDAPAPTDPLFKGVEIDAKPATDAAKQDAPPRPFGALAPGLGVAAQITAQQTPEQSAAADRLAQLASAVEDKATDTIVKTADDAKPADTAPTPAKHSDPQPQIDAPAQRHANVDAAAATAEARSARPAMHPIVVQVAAQVARAAADGTDRINIRLSPAELGRIDVKLDFGPDGRVQAVFAAERPQTMELLQRDARDLERALQDAGLRADSGSLSFNLRGQGRDAQNGPTGNGGGRDGAPAEIASPQLQAYTAGYSGSGRLDIRI